MAGVGEQEEQEEQKEVFGNLGSFVDRRLKASGCARGLAGFLGTLRSITTSAGGGVEVLSSREASAKYFDAQDDDKDGSTAAEDVRKLCMVWEYCRRQVPASDATHARRRAKLGEVMLSDEDLCRYLPIEVALLALLSCSFAGGLEEMSETFLSIYRGRNNISCDASSTLVDCVDALIPDDARHAWRCLTWAEDMCEAIPGKFAGTVFPKHGVDMLEYTPEGLSMSVEKIVCALLHFGAITYSVDARGWGALYCSHVLLPAERNDDDKENNNGVAMRHVLAEDFFFNRLPLGYNDTRMLYVTTEGRCITNTDTAAFLTPVNSCGLLGVRFAAADDSETRYYSVWHVTAMAKYDVSAAEFEYCLSREGLSVDHLTRNHAYNQPALVQLANGAQQAANKRPINRETFLSESVADDPLFIPFDDLDPAQQEVASACMEEDGLAMARLQEGRLSREVYRRFKQRARDEEALWVDLESDRMTRLYVEKKCIWKPTANSWLFLHRPLKTTPQKQYRKMTVAGKECLIHTAISLTRLYHRVMRTGSAFAVEGGGGGAGLGEVARPTADGTGVQIKMLWEADGQVRRLTTDHIDQNKGNNDPENLRLLCNRGNTVAACGGRIEVLVRPYAQAQTCLPPISIRADCLVDAVMPIKAAMREMGYPKEFQEYADSTVLGWFGSGGLPQALGPFIEVIRQDMEPPPEDDENEDDDEDEDRLKGLYGYTFRDGHSGECFEDLVIGRKALATMLGSVFGVQMGVARIYDSLNDSVLNPHEPEKRRRRCVASVLGSKQPAGHRYQILDVYRLFGSVSSSNLFEVTFGEHASGTCRGLWQVVAWLEHTEGLMERLKKYIPQGEAPTGAWIHGLVRAYFHNQNEKSLLHEEGVCIARRSRKRAVVVPSGKYSLLFDTPSLQGRTHMDPRDVQKMLVDQGIGLFHIGTVRSWLSRAVGSTGIHYNLGRLGVCDIQQPSREEKGREEGDGGTGTNVILKYTSIASGVSSSASFGSIMAAVRFALGALGFDEKCTRRSAASLRKQLVDNRAVLQNDSYKGVSLEYEKATRNAACRSVYVIARMTSPPHGCGGLVRAERVAQSVSFTLPDFVSSNADFIDEHLFKKGAGRSATTTVSQIQGQLDRRECACLEFVGFSGGDRKSLAEYLRACEVSDADRKIVLMQQDGLYHREPLTGVSWCLHVFTKRLLESAMKRVEGRHRNQHVNVVFKARAYLLGYSDEYEEEGVKHDLNQFLLHTLRGEASTAPRGGSPGLRLDLENVNTAPGSDGWVDLAYPPSGSRDIKGRPRNRMIRHMMSGMGLKPFSRATAKNGFLSRTVRGKEMYYDASRDSEEIPFLYRWMTDRKQIFLLVAIQKQ